MKNYQKIMHAAFLTACLLTLFAACSSRGASTAAKARTRGPGADRIITAKLDAALFKIDATLSAAVQLRGFLDLGGSISGPACSPAHSP